MSNTNKTICPHCGQEVTQPPRGRRRIFCNYRCKHNYYCNQKAHQKTLTKKEESLVTAKCLHCGKDFEKPENSKRIGCTRNCSFAYGRREEVSKIQELAVEAQNENTRIKVSDFSVLLYQKGFGKTAIAEALGIKTRTVEDPPNSATPYV
jgi:endogenous inhibitor of DNA gyrase (YacG/DUF329 family)